MKLADSTLLIDLLNGRESARKVINQELVTTQINMFEVIRGMFLRNISKKRFLLAMELFKDIGVLPFHDAAVIRCAEISADLIKKGKMIHDSDCIVAGIALSHGVDTIITNNTKHFERIKGLKVEGY